MPKNPTGAPKAPQRIRLVSQLTPGMRKTLANMKPQFEELHAQGKSTTEISVRYNLPRIGVEWILGMIPAPDVAGVPTGGDGGAESPGEAGGAGSGAPNESERGEPVSAPEARSQGDQPPGGDMPATPVERPPQGNEHNRAPPIPSWVPAGAPTTRAPFQRDYAVGSGVEPQAGPLEGPFQMRTLDEVLFDILTEIGLKKEQARGICRLFRWSNPRDYSKLHELMSRYGVVPSLQDTVVEAWKNETRDVDEAPTEGSSPEETLRYVDRILGRDRGNPPTENMDFDALKRRAMELEVKEREAAITQREQSLRDKQESLGATTGAGRDDGTMEVMLNVGGMVYPKRIRESQLPVYRQFIVQPKGQGGEEEVPPWAKAIVDQNKALQDRLDRRDIQEAEDRKEHERDERLVRILNERLGPIEQRFNATPQESETAKRLASLEAKLADKSAEELREWQKRMEDLVRQGMTLDAAEKRLAAEDQVARHRGFVRPDEASRLEQDQVELEAERAELRNKAKAQGDLATVGVETLRGRPKILEKIVEKGGVERGLKVLDRLTTPPDEQGGEPRQPSEEEIRALGSRLPPSPSEGTLPPPGAHGVRMIGNCPVCGEPLFEALVHDCPGPQQATPPGSQPPERARPITEAEGRQQ